MVEQNAHSLSRYSAFLRSLGIQAASREFQNIDDLVARKVMPLHDFLDARPQFEILEDQRYRHPRVLKDPGAAQLARDTFYGWTLRPIKRHCDLSFSS